MQASSPVDIVLMKLLFERGLAAEGSRATTEGDPERQSAESAQEQRGRPVPLVEKSSGGKNA